MTVSPETSRNRQNGPAALRPLEGIRVLDFGAFLAGPYAGLLLATLGAEVVKVEPPQGGDPFRRGEGAGNPFFQQMNIGKKSIAVDLKSPDGIELIKALLPHFDVFLENSRPGKMAALGLGPEVVHKINPDMVYSAVSGFGDGGPWRDRAAFDTIGLSMSGFLSIMSDRDNVQLAGTCVGDLTTALVSVIGILAALVGRNKGPGASGVEIQTSLLEAMSTLTVDAMTQLFTTGDLPHRQSRHPAAQSFCLKTADTKTIAVHLSSSQKFWESLAAAIDRPDLLDDPRLQTFDLRREHYFELVPMIVAEFAKYDREECERRLIAADVPYAHVLTAEELPEHPQWQWLDVYTPAQDNGLRLLRAPWRIDGQRADRGGRVADIGEHSREIAGSVLPAAKVENLIRAGVLVQS